MTLEHAIEVLNRNRHRGTDGWRLHYQKPCPDEEQLVSYSNDYASHMLDPFEACAIARAYEAEAWREPVAQLLDSLGERVWESEYGGPEISVDREPFEAARKRLQELLESTDG